MASRYAHWKGRDYASFPNASFQDERHIVVQVDNLKEFTAMVIDYFSVANTVAGIPFRTEWISLIQARFRCLENRQQRFFDRFRDEHDSLSQEDYIRVTAPFLHAKVYRHMCTAKKHEGLQCGLRNGGYLHLKGILGHEFVRKFLLPEITGLVSGKFRGLHNTNHQVESVMLPVGLDPASECERYPLLHGIIG
jgi:hypothetical protein